MRRALFDEVIGCLLGRSQAMLGQHLEGELEVHEAVVLGCPRYLHSPRHLVVLLDRHKRLHQKHLHASNREVSDAQTAASWAQHGQGREMGPPLPQRAAPKRPGSGHWGAGSGVLTCWPQWVLCSALGAVVSSTTSSAGLPALPCSAQPRRNPPGAAPGEGQSKIGPHMQGRAVPGAVGIRSPSSAPALALGGTAVDGCEMNGRGREGSATREGWGQWGHGERGQWGRGCTLK